ncbi:MAG: site-specific integrase, partial [Methylococcales bacterium]
AELFMASIQKIKRKSGFVYRIFIRNKGSRPISKIFKSKQLAKEFIRKIEYKIEYEFIHGAAQPQKIRLADLVVKYMESFEGADPKTRQAEVNRWLKLIGNKYLTEITKHDVRLGLDQLSNGNGLRGNGPNKSTELPRPRANSTINRNKSVISAVLQFACNEYDLQVNVARQIRAKPVNNARMRFLSDKERLKLLAACKQSEWGSLYLIVLMAITTGARRSEILNLTWGDIDFEKQNAHLHKTKNGEPRVLPLIDEVLKELRIIKMKSKSNLVFYSELKPEKPFDFRKHWQKAVYDVELGDFRFHDLRHTCASYLAQNGATLLEIADVLGHRQIEMTKRYSHLCVEHKRRLIDSVMNKLESK